MTKRTLCIAIATLSAATLSAQTQCPYSLLGVSPGDSRAQVEETLTGLGLVAQQQTTKGAMSGVLAYQSPRIWPPEGVVLTREQQAAIRMHDRLPEQHPWPEAVPPRPEPKTDVRVELSLGRNSTGPLGHIRVTHNFVDRDDAAKPENWGETEFGAGVQERWEHYCSNGGDHCVYREASATTTFNIGLTVDGCYYNMNAGNGQMWERVMPTPQ